MKAILGDIRHPKSEGLIIPSNSIGLMTSGRELIIAKTTLGGVPKEVKKFVKEHKVNVGDSFSTYSGRMNKRKVIKIYHAVIKKWKSDFTSVYIVSMALDKAIKQSISDGLKSIAICGIGIDDGDLDPIVVARLTVSICKKYNGLIDIKIIDENEIFINEIKKEIKQKD